MEYCIVWKNWIAAGKVMTIGKLDCSSVAARFSEHLQGATEELRASIPCRWEYSTTYEWYYLSCRKDRTCDWCAIMPKYGLARICSEDDMAGSILSQCYLLMQEEDIAPMRHASCLHRPLHCRRIRILVATTCQSAAQSNTDLSRTQSVIACVSICFRSAPLWSFKSWSNRAPFCLRGDGFLPLISLIAKPPNNDKHCKASTLEQRGLAGRVFAQQFT